MNQDDGTWVGIVNRLYWWKCNKCKEENKITWMECWACGKKQPSEKK